MEARCCYAMHSEMVPATQLATHKSKVVKIQGSAADTKVHKYDRINKSDRRDRRNQEDN